MRSGLIQIQREAHSTNRVWAITDVSVPQNLAQLAVIDWVISYVNEWEDYSNYFGEGVEISRNWATTHFLVFRQLALEEINPEYSLEGLMLKLKLQYFGHLMQRADSLEKTLILGKIEGRRRRGQQRIRSLDGITDSMDVNLSTVWEIVKDREAWRAAIHGVT